MPRVMGLFHKMMKAYVINQKGTTELPAGAELVHVGQLNKDYVVWAIVDDSEEMLTRRKLRIYDTGQPLPVDCGKYLGTIYAYGIERHVFDEGDK